MNEYVIETILASIALVLVATSVFYEILRAVLKIVSKYNLRARPLMFFLVIAIFSAHTIVVWMYGTAYYSLVHIFNFDPLGGISRDDFFGYIYFSAATYSSLGIGDIFSYGALQFIAGVQVLNGLILIGWSVMFSYLSVQKVWDESGVNVAKIKDK